MYDTPKQKNKGLKLIIITLVFLFSIVIFYIGLQNVKILNTHGHSMQPNIPNDSYVLCVKSNSIERVEDKDPLKESETMMIFLIGR